MSSVLDIFRFLLNVVYAIIKIAPVKNNRVVFISRQDDNLSLDFSMLKRELEMEKEDIEIKTICCRMGDDSSNYLKFAGALLRSMRYLATSRVCVLDAYWPAVSMLKHKKSLKVIQMWHALGKIKQSGYQTLNKEFGRSKTMAEKMRMHRGYDYIIAGGKAWNPMYCASFDTTEDKLLNIGLPRIDYLIDSEQSNKEKIYKAYPEFRGKTVILYAPTFRRNESTNWNTLIEQIDFGKYILIVKAHPNQEITWDTNEVYDCPDFKAVDLLSVADYLITDYSAIAIEGAILNRKTYYFLYDFEQYKKSNGMNIDLFKEMDGCAFRTAEKLMADLTGGNYKQQALDCYREKFLPEKLGQSTKMLAKTVIDNMN